MKLNMPPTNDHAQLQSMLQRFEIDVDDDKIALLDSYRAALWEWNERLNLTRHTDYEKFVGRDVVDSLAFEPFLPPGARVLDVGTGGGVPGMILAIVRPDLEIVACESVAKRAIAAKAIAQQAGLELRVDHARAEGILEKEMFEVLIARAVAPLHKLMRWLAPHWDHFEQLLLLKGPSWTDERHQAREAGLLRGLDLRRLASYTSPVSGAESVLLRIRSRNA